MQVEIAWLILTRHLTLLEAYGHRLVTEPEVLSFLIRHGFYPRPGTRPLRDADERLVADAMWASLLDYGSGDDFLSAAED